MKYFKNTSWLFFGKILQMAVTLFVGVYVIRYLGPSRYGLLSYAVSFVGLFSALASLGLDNIIVRELVKTPQKRDELLGTAFVLKLFGVSLMAGAIFIGIQFTNNDNFTNLLIVIIAAGFLFRTFNVIDLNFQAIVQSRYVVYSQTTQVVFSSIIRLVLIWVAAPLLWFAVVSVIDIFIIAAGLVWYYPRKIGRLRRWTFRKEMAISLLKDSWPLILSGVAVIVYMRIDQVMIKNMMDSKSVGYYSAAVKLSEAWYFIPVVILSSLFPAIVNAKKQSNELYLERLQKLYTFMVWLAIGIAFPMTFLSDWIINILYGPIYSPAGSVLMIHIWAGVFVFLGVAFGNFLIVENYTKKALSRTFIGALMNVILNFFLIPLYGIKGAAIATLISQFTANFLYDFFDKDLRKYLYLKTNSFFPIYLLKNR